MIAVTQAVAPHMMARGSGTIVVIGSSASYINTPLMADYGCGVEHCWRRRPPALLGSRVCGTGRALGSR